MISTQELRRDVEGIHSPTPQPEDPGRSLDPTSEEDPDIKVELIDGVFHQLSMDNALVTITACWKYALEAIIKVLLLYFLVHDNCLLFML